MGRGSCSRIEMSFCLNIKHLGWSLGFQRIVPVTCEFRFAKDKEEVMGEHRVSLWFLLRVQG